MQVTIPGDLLKLNNEDYSPTKTFENAIDWFNDHVKDIRGEDLDTIDYGFELGFWKAIEIVSGITNES